MGTLLAIGIMCLIAWALVKQVEKWFTIILKAQDESIERYRAENKRLWGHIMEDRGLVVEFEEEDKKETLH